MSDALDDLRAHEAEAEVAPDFAARQRAATRALVSEYSTGRGPGVEAGLASADRALALIDAATEPSKPAAQPTKPAPVEDPLAGFDAVLKFYGTDPEVLRRTNPFAYLALGQAYMIDLARMQAITQACMVGAMAIARAASEQRAYVAAPGARNALRHTLHATGVLR